MRWPGACGADTSPGWCCPVFCRLGPLRGLCEAHSRAGAAPWRRRPVVCRVEAGVSGPRRALAGALIAFFLASWMGLFLVLARPGPFWHTVPRLAPPGGGDRAGAARGGRRVAPGGLAGRRQDVPLGAAAGFGPGDLRGPLPGVRCQSASPRLRPQRLPAVGRRSGACGVCRGPRSRRVGRGPRRGGKRARSTRNRSRPQGPRRGPPAMPQRPTSGTGSA